ncbi:hypothetical protein CPLU01_04517 [Colletotrichum plurivorum]|uniref:Uncharacterized protein n=1 Tax=Colletotrichum plurivorum TaxID=2175906 RepID=A0A8H6NIW5_9PEZI|nr:hypothetical protein CPLU01_04517 [Colletotrichum plurivorum]
MVLAGKAGNHWSLLAHLPGYLPVYPYRGLLPAQQHHQLMAVFSLPVYWAAGEHRWQEQRWKERNVVKGQSDQIVAPPHPSPPNVKFENHLTSGGGKRLEAGCGAPRRQEAYSGKGSL